MGEIIKPTVRPIIRPIIKPIVGGGAPSPVTRVYADFGPSGKSVSFSSVTPDRIVMFVYPRAGNTGLPAGAPAVTNERFQTIDFAYSGGALTSIGSGFNGFIANIQLFSGSTLLLDEPVNNNDGLTYNNFQSDDIRSFTQNADDDWLGVELWPSTLNYESANSGVISTITSGSEWDVVSASGSPTNVADGGIVNLNNTVLVPGRRYRYQVDSSGLSDLNLAAYSSSFALIGSGQAATPLDFLAQTGSPNRLYVTPRVSSSIRFSNASIRELLEVA